MDFDMLVMAPGESLWRKEEILWDQSRSKATETMRNPLGGLLGWKRGCKCGVPSAALHGLRAECKIQGLFLLSPKQPNYWIIVGCNWMVLWHLRNIFTWFIWSQEWALEAGIAGYYLHFISEEPEAPRHYFPQDTWLINRKICAFNPRACAFPLTLYPLLPSWLLCKVILLSYLTCLH